MRRTVLLLSFALVLLALLGHGAFWVGLNNRWHGTGYPRKVVKSGSLVIYFVLVGLPLAVLAQFAADCAASDRTAAGALPPLGWASGYTIVCAAMGAIHLPLWARRRWQEQRLPDQVRPEADERIDIQQVLGVAPTTSPRTQLFCRLPFNHLWEVHVSQYEVVLPTLPRELDGLSICHLSDLHFSNRIERSYYDEIVRRSNALGADIVAVTGDICDKADRIDWIPPTLGALTARVAKFSVLGNHDLRTRDVPRLRRTLTESGFHDVGGRTLRLDTLPIVVAGNERPWFADSAPTIESLPAGSLKLLLSHSPDQLGWAEEHQFDLMLAGHTHGGQIRFPVLGPVVCPSRYGTKYASGFYTGAPTLLHVSRGTGSLFPFRLNCRPEVVKLVLRAKR